ncbi:MAG: hypothetical protein ACERJ1_08745 [Halodesulfovibrio sp.]|uniref:hypothetical protein n=1 Tax=Halodesulfovibrio sp. TaxID=1912772 RepID=UPI00359ECE1B
MISEECVFDWFDKLFEDSKKSSSPNVIFCQNLKATFPFDFPNPEINWEEFLKRSKQLLAQNVITLVEYKDPMGRNPRHDHFKKGINWSSHKRKLKEPTIMSCNVHTNQGNISIGDNNSIENNAPVLKLTVEESEALASLIKKLAQESNSKQGEKLSKLITTTDSATNLIIKAISFASAVF